MSAFSDTISPAATTTEPAGGSGRPAHRKLLLHVILIAGAVVMALPFAWMLFSSFKPLGEIFIQPPKLLPQDWNLQGYRTALGGADFVRGFWNSVYIAVTVTVPPWRRWRSTSLLMAAAPPGIARSRSSPARSATLATDWALCAAWSDTRWAARQPPSLRRAAWLPSGS